MFSKKPHSDVKKSSQKVLDPKKDCIGRLKHLRIVLENSDTAEAKSFFENNYSHIYYIFYDVFINAENNLKLRAHHRTAREDLEIVRFIFEKLLILLPELVNRRWQCHSIKRIMKKFLHYGNSTKLRRDGVRLFLLWYQILGENAPEELDSMFVSLVPGLIPGVPNPYIISPSLGHFRGSSTENYPETSTFYATASDTPDVGPVTPIDIAPLLPPLSGDQLPDDCTRFYLDSLLEYMVSQVCKVEWRGKSEVRYLKSYQFLFEKFKKHYLPHIFPSFTCTTNLFLPSLDLPGLRHEIDLKAEHDKSRFAQKDSLLHCQSTVIRWITHFTQCNKKLNVTFEQPVHTETKEQNESNRPVASNESDSNQSTNNLLTTSNMGLERDPSTNSLGNDDLTFRDYIIVRDTLYSSRENINMVHEVFRQAFYMHFRFASTMRKVVAVYREWIHKNTSERPMFLEEPIQPLSEPKEDKTDGSISSKASQESTYQDQDPEDLPGMRLRKDSYLKAIHSDNNHLRAGMQNMLIVFLTNAANVFLLNLCHDNMHMLEEQVDMCKRVLNIYRYMVMNVQMERRVWQQLLKVLIQITALVLREVPPLRKEDTLGGRLAPALFQTLIVTWIKANLNVVIAKDLWDHFLNVLSSLTLWEELIKEWAKTMETLTRVLAKQVYHLDLSDLPLDRLSEQKMKRNRGIKKTVVGNLEEKFEKCKSKSESAGGKAGFVPGSMFDDNSSEGTAGRSIHPIMRTRSGSGDHMKMRRDDGGIHRSHSDSNLFRKYHSHHRLKDRGLICYIPAQKQVFVTGASPSIEDEFAKVVPFEEYKDHVRRLYHKHRSRSLDFLTHRAESPCFSESSEFRSRSPSPTPSSGLENTSIKDSPMQIDAVVSSADNSCSNSESFQGHKMDSFEILIPKKELGTGNIEARSVISGGTTRGWLPDVAVVLWKRMLGVLGDINQIKDATVHAQVLKYLVDLSELFVKIRDNMGVTLDNQTTPSPPELVPPLMLITPWLFEALTLPDKFKEGKLLAFKLLCILIVRRHDLPLPKEYIAHFYYALHYGLMANDQDIINAIVKHCGPNFFSIGLPGSTLLIMDFIYAADTVISSSDVRGVPRTEAMSILGALLCLTNVYQEIPTLQPSSTEPFTIACKDAKDHITSILFKAGKREPAGLARCIAINSIGLYLYEELMNKTSHYRIKEAVTVLLIAVRSSVSSSASTRIRSREFNCKAVARVASDMLLLLCDHAEELQKGYSDLIHTVIEVLSSTLENLLPNSDAMIIEEDKKLILSLIHCIGEWCFMTKFGSPISTEQDTMPLLSVFKVLNAAVSGKKSDAPQTTQSLTELSTPDVDPNVQVENFQEGSTPLPSAPPRSHHSPEKARSADSSFFRPMLNQDHNLVIRLAAKSLLHNIVNHLGHFPMGIGATRLTSLVNEHDDVPNLTGDELSAEVFHAPNVQFFVLNNNSIVSFIEIPALDMPGGGATAGLTTSKSQVRVIIRDLGGKFSWDSSILYGPPDFYFTTPEFDPFSEPSSLDVPSPNVLSLNEHSSSLSSQCLRHRPQGVLPTIENSAEDMDNLDDLLQYVGYTSIECLNCPSQALNSASKLQNEEGRQKETDIINVLLNQSEQERAQFKRYASNSCMEAKPALSPLPAEANSPFQHCRLLLNQLGFTSWERRSHFDLLKKNEQLLRELRNLDKQVCRDTHKIAVIYVASGQEDKNTILSNPGASQEFEEFVAGLGWEVELENHPGFLGGLQRNKSTGDTAPYYSTPFTEVIFHVSTRMSNIHSEPDAIHKKVCHLGNDEVHIVWSEHLRDYRKEIIATEFCDVLIVIYPIGGRMYRIHISRKLGIPFFGPLFNGAIVGHKVLPGLVRATAINANRAKRSLISLYMNYYEERNKSLETIVQNHKDLTTFEQFAASVYSPAPPKTGAPSRSSGPPSRADSACSRGIPNLAAALIDSHNRASSYSPIIRSRTVSQSTMDDMSPHSSPQVSLRERPVSIAQT